MLASFLRCQSTIETLNQTVGDGGAYARDKNTSARLCTKNAGGGGGLCARGGIFAGHYGKYEIFISKTTIIETTCAVNGF